MKIIKILKIAPRSRWKTELYMLLLGFRGNNWDVTVQLDNGKTKMVSIKWAEKMGTKQDYERFATYVKNKATYGKQHNSDVDIIIEKRHGEEARKQLPEWAQKLIGAEI